MPAVYIARIRKDTRIKKVLECIEEIHRAKKKYASAALAIHIAYMLLRSELDELEKLPDFLGHTGADQTVVSSLSFVASPEMEFESILSTGVKEYSELKWRLIQIKDESARNAAQINFHIASPEQDQFSCSEDVPCAVVVGSDGRVSPCVMKQIPVHGENYYYVGGQKHLLQNLRFGKIPIESLKTVWYRKEYQYFIQTIGSNKMPEECRNCYKGNIDNFE